MKNVLTVLRGEFLSDVGGTAGLVLGLSVASIIRYLEAVLCVLCKRITTLFKHFTNRKQKHGQRTEQSTSTEESDYSIQTIVSSCDNASKADFKSSKALNVLL